MYNTKNQDFTKYFLMKDVPVICNYLDKTTNIYEVKHDSRHSVLFFHCLQNMEIKSQPHSPRYNFILGLTQPVHILNS